MNTPITLQTTKGENDIYDIFLKEFKLDANDNNYRKFHQLTKKILNDYCNNRCEIKASILDEKIYTLDLKDSEHILSILKEGTDDTMVEMNLKSPNWAIHCYKQAGSVAAARYFISLSIFNNFIIRPKSSGNGAGFVLEDPYTSDIRWFFKRTGNEPLEFFISLCFNYLGIKYPETKLFQDSGGNLWLATLDMSRNYKKGNVIKQKTFKTLDNYFVDQEKVYNYSIYNDIGQIKDEENDPGRNELNYGLFSKRVKRSQYAPKFADKQWESVQGNQELEPLYKKLIKQFATEDEVAFVALHKKPRAKQARITFAESLIAREIFSLADIGHHGGNFGLITTISNKEVEKIGLIDFSQAAFLNRYSPKPTFIGDYQKIPSLTDLVRGEYKLCMMIPVLQEISKLISKDEMLLALKNLLKPKQREYSNEGYLLKNDKNTNFVECIERAFNDFTLAMNPIEMDGKDQLIQNIRECKDAYIKRMKVLQLLFVESGEVPPLTAFKLREVEEQTIPSSFVNKKKPAISNSLKEVEKKWYQKAWNHWAILLLSALIILYLGMLIASIVSQEEQRN